jgi:hypothetical protein
MRLGAEKTLRGVSGLESDPSGAPYPSVFMAVRGRTAENSAAGELVKRCRSPPACGEQIHSKSMTRARSTGNSKLQTPNPKTQTQTRNPQPVARCARPATGYRPAMHSRWDAEANQRPEKRLPYCLGLATSSMCGYLLENELGIADGTEAAFGHRVGEVVAGFTSDRLGSAATIATDTHSRWRAAAVVRGRRPSLG